MTTLDAGELDHLERLADAAEAQEEWDRQAGDAIGELEAACDPDTIRRLVAAARLDTAWREAEKALPDDWKIQLSVGRARRDFYTATASYCYSLRHYRENVGPARSTPFEMAHDTTPAAALLALAAALRKPVTA